MVDFVGVGAINFETLDCGDSPQSYLYLGICLNQLYVRDGVIF
jgi:hypothetical protein